MRFRQGSKVRRNVYDGDKPVFMAANEEEAEHYVALLNDGERWRNKESDSAEILNDASGMLLDLDERVTAHEDGDKWLTDRKEAWYVNMRRQLDRFYVHYASKGLAVPGRLLVEYAQGVRLRVESLQTDASCLKFSYHDDSKTLRLAGIPRYDRDSLAELIDKIGREPLDGPRDLDVALDAIAEEFRQNPEEPYGYER